MHKKLKSILFLAITRPQNGHMPGVNEGEKRHKFAVNKVIFVQNDTNIVNSFSRSLIGYLKKSIRSHWLKKLTG